MATAAKKKFLIVLAGKMGDDESGGLLLLSPWASPARRRQRSDVCASEISAPGGAVGGESVVADVGEGIGEWRELRVASLPWGGWRDRALGTVGGSGEATFETLSVLGAYDGDWLEVSAGGACRRLVRVRAVAQEPQCSACGSVADAAPPAAACKARRMGVIYVRRSVLEHLQRGGGTGAHAAFDSGDVALCAARTKVQVRRYGSSPGPNPVPVAARVDLARVARHDSSSTRDYTKELRAFFEPGAGTPSEHGGCQHVLAPGDIFGVWVRELAMHAEHSGAPDGSESDSDGNSEEGAGSAETPASRPGPSQCPGKRVAIKSSNRRGHHLVYFQVCSRCVD